MKLIFISQCALSFALLASASAAQQEIFHIDGSASSPGGVTYTDALGSYVRNLGDVNGDGYEDFGIGFRPFYPFSFSNSGLRVCSGTNGVQIGNTISGGPNGQSSNEFFAEAACAAGDMNLDGFVDIAISAPDGPNAPALSMSGIVSVYTQSGATWTLIKSWSLAADDVDFGYSLLALGDTNGDGFPDLAVGDPLSGPGGTSAGRVRYYSLATPSGLGITINGLGTVEQFGAAMIPAGYVDGDGVLDYYVGAPFGGATTAGVVRLISGASGATLATINGTAALQHFGKQLAPAGDIDGDGSSDFFATVDLPAGAAVEAVSARNGVLWTYAPAISSSTFGAELASISDVDGDGVRDVFVTDRSGAVTPSKLPILFSGKTSVILPQVAFVPPSAPNTSVIPGSVKTVATLENIVGDKGRVVTGSPDYSITNTQFHAPIASGTACGYVYEESGVELFGKGTPGCFGPESLSTLGAAKLGNLTFQVNGSAAPASSLGLLLFTDKRLPTPSDPLGIAVRQCIDLINATQVYALDFNSDPLGAAQITIPIPNSPSLAGSSYYGQAIWAWPPATCTPSTYGLSSSTGVALRIQL